MGEPRRCRQGRGRRTGKGKGEGLLGRKGCPTDHLLQKHIFSRTGSLRCQGSPVVAGAAGTPVLPPATEHSGPC